MASGTFLDAADTTRIRKNLAAAWTSLNPVLEGGAIGYETDTGKAKLGDGSTVWVSLPYLSTGGGGGSNVVTGLQGDITGVSIAETVAGVGSSNAQAARDIAIGPNAHASGGASVALGGGGVTGGGAQAAGDSAVAIGRHAQADFFSTVGIGPDAHAEKEYSIAVGDSASAAAPGSIAIGTSAVVDGNNKDYAISIGGLSTVSGAGDVAVGQYASAHGDVGSPSGDPQATAVGNNAYAAGGSTAVGVDAHVGGVNGVAIGANNDSGADRIVSIGFLSNTGTGDSPVAIGHAATTNGTQAVAIGDGAIANHAEGGSIYIGSVNTAGRGTTGKYAIGIGSDCKSTGHLSVAIGGYAADAEADSAIAIGTCTAFGVESIAMGTGADATADRSIAVGPGATANGVASVSIGDTALADGIGAIAIGCDGLGEGPSNRAYARGDQDVSIGGRSIADSTGTPGYPNTAVGAYSNAGGSGHCVAAGAYAKAYSLGTTALGYGATAGSVATSEPYATALGLGVTASKAGAVAVGCDSGGASATATTQDDFVLGTALHNVKIPGTTHGLDRGVNTVATSGAAQTLAAVLTATVNYLTLTANCTLTFPTAKAGRIIRVALKQDGTGTRTVTWPGTVKWPAGVAPTLTLTAAKTDLFEFLCVDGTNWLGQTLGQNY